MAMPVKIIYNNISRLRILEVNNPDEFFALSNMAIWVKNNQCFANGCLPYNNMKFSTPQNMNVKAIPFACNTKSRPVGPNNM